MNKSIEKLKKKHECVSKSPTVNMLNESKKFLKEQMLNHYIKYGKNEYYINFRDKNNLDQVHMTERGDGYCSYSYYFKDKHLFDLRLEVIDAKYLWVATFDDGREYGCRGDNATGIIYTIKRKVI